jgi:Lon protease-like protein
MSDHQAGLEGFSGYARLFPLPNLVLFPHVMQPLHIFEPRYRQMTADALDDDKLIALVLPSPGWESDYGGKPPLHSVACLGKIIADQRLEDGRFNLLLRGLSRIRIAEEVANGKLYRTARVQLLGDVPLDDSADEARLRYKLLDLAPRLFPQPGKVKEEFRKLLMGAMPIAVLGDIVAFALPLEASLKQELLEELDVGRRLAALTAHLEAHAPPPSLASDRKFPPDFSSN